jgi:chorismate synthase
VNYELREISGNLEMQTLAALEREIWNSDHVPAELYRAMQDEGALLAGAFTPVNTLVAFVFGFPTKIPGVQHSHSLGVLPGHRAAGLGAKLKWFQRDWCLAKGIHTVHWTYDPLRVPNAKLNIGKLGATASRYLENYYGTLTGINAGAPSDRVMAQWVLNDPRVIARLEGARTIPNAPEINTVTGEEPGEINLTLEAPYLKMRLPGDYSSILTQNPDLALAWRLHGRKILQYYFAHNYRIAEFTLEGGAGYLLEKNLQTNPLRI